MKQQSSLQTICLGALFLAMNIALSAVGIPVPGGHFYLNDIVICTAALLLNGSAACIAGSLGAFLGDLLFYPAPMFVSLVTRALQVLVITTYIKKHPRPHERLHAAIGLALGAVVMVIGYTLGRAFIYSTPQYALVKLPYQILQAGIGAAGAYGLCYKAGLRSLLAKKEQSPEE